MNEYLVWSNEHNAWWKPNKNGYTIYLEDAGRYTREDAIAICAHLRDGWNAHQIPSEIPVRAEDALECSAKDLSQNTKTRTFTMPVLGTHDFVVWMPTATDRSWAQNNHGGQTLETLASRGGLGWCELEALLMHEPYNMRPRLPETSREHVIEMLADRIMA